MDIARLSHNQMLLCAVGEARCHMERIMSAAIDIQYYGEFPTREHLDILKAMQERDAEGARQRMREHIMQSKSKVLRLSSAAPMRD